MLVTSELEGHVLKEAEAFGKHVRSQISRNTYQYQNAPQYNIIT